MTTSKNSKVRFFSLDRPARIKNVTQLKHFIESIFKQERLRLSSLNYIFCSDKTVLAVNKKYLSHDFYTDVITFDLTQNGEPITAEVYVSVDRIRENAKTLGVSIKSEVHRVLFHAALHLAGFDDKKKKAIEIMRHKEDKLLKQYFNK